MSAAFAQRPSKCHPIDPRVRDLQPPTAARGRLATMQKEASGTGGLSLGRLSLQGAGAGVAASEVVFRMIRREFGTGRGCCGGAHFDAHLTSFPLKNGHFTIKGLQIREVRARPANLCQN